MSSIIYKIRAQSHFLIFDEVQWPFLSLESQYLPKDAKNSGTIEVNFYFRAGHGTDAPNPGLSREFRDGWHYAKGWALFKRKNSTLDKLSGQVCESSLLGICEL